MSNASLRGVVTFPRHCMLFSWLARQTAPNKGSRPRHSLRLTFLFGFKPSVLICDPDRETTMSQPEV